MRTITAETDIYKYADKITKFLVREYTELFDDFKADLLKSDEINILQRVNTLYSNMRRLTEQWMFELATRQFEYIQQGDYDFNLIDTVWLQEIFDNYNPVTKYVYSNEIDRKRSYLYEAIMSDGEISNDADKALRLWCLMIGQMAIDVTDKATYTAYKYNGIERVMWISEHDSKTCDECNDLHGKVFPIDEVPEKPHIHCRCFTIPVR